MMITQPQSTKTLFERSSPPAQSEEIVERLERMAIELAILEDLGPERVDLTTLATIPSKSLSTGVFLCKENDVVLAGLKAAARVFGYFSPAISFEVWMEDGTKVVEAPVTIATARGPTAALLTGERLVLNLIQRMSGIATVTSRFTEKAKKYSIAILDTRKTSPGLRVFEREAVRIGGGVNHRFGLFSEVLIKDNHISVCGGVRQAIEAARSQLGHDCRIEVEVTNFDELDSALSANAEKVMLDNMTPAMVRAAISRVNGKAFIEVSGGVNSTNIDDYLIPGVDAISIGALTHSPRCVDISLEVETRQ